MSSHKFRNLLLQQTLRLGVLRAAAQVEFRGQPRFQPASAEERLHLQCAAFDPAICSCVTALAGVASLLACLNFTGRLKLADEYPIRAIQGSPRLGSLHDLFKTAR